MGRVMHWKEWWSMLWLVGTEYFFLKKKEKEKKDYFLTCSLVQEVIRKFDFLVAIFDLEENLCESVIEIV
jgi:Ni,Fe-hydrogenase I cytochrome b subunit